MSLCLFQTFRKPQLSQICNISKQKLLIPIISRTGVSSLCSSGLMKSYKHLRSKELNQRRAFPLDEAGKKKSDLFNHPKVSIDAPVNSEDIDTLGEFLNSCLISDGEVPSSAAPSCRFSKYFKMMNVFRLHRNMN